MSYHNYSLFNMEFENNCTDDGTDDVFGTLEDADMSSIPEEQEDPQTLTPQAFQQMAQQMAGRINPQEAQRMRDNLKNMPLDLKMIPIMVQMKQFAALGFMLKGNEDAQLPKAIGLLLNLAKDQSEVGQLHIAQLVLCLKPTTCEMTTFHTQAQNLLDELRTQKQLSRSTKSQKLRAKRERVRKARMKKRKK